MPLKLLMRRFHFSSKLKSVHPLNLHSSQSSAIIRPISQPLLKRHIAKSAPSQFARPSEGGKVTNGDKFIFVRKLLAGFSTLPQLIANHPVTPRLVNGARKAWGNAKQKPKRLGFFMLSLGAYVIYERYFQRPLEQGIPEVTSSFVANEGYLKLQAKLKQDFRKTTNYIVLVGDSGVGKSIAAGQIFSHPDTWFQHGIFQKKDPWLKVWISTDPEQSFSETEFVIKKQLLDLAQALDDRRPLAKWLFRVKKQDWVTRLTIKIMDPFLNKLPVRWQEFIKPTYVKESEQETLKRLKYYLEKNPGWLLVVDNLQVPVEMVKEENLPQQGGVVVISTNDKALAPKVDQRVEFELLNDKDGRELVKKHLSISGSEKDIDDLVQGTGRLLLGIVQACGYINSTNMSVRSYLEKLEKTPLEILGYDINWIKKHHNLVRTTKLMLHHIREKNKNADTYNKMYSYFFDLPMTSEEHLLRTMSLLASQPISEDLLKKAFLNGFSHNQAMFDQAVLELTQFNIVERVAGSGQDYFKIHPLRQRILFSLLRPSTIDAPAWSSFFTLRHYFSKEANILDSILKAFTQVSLPSNNFLELLQLLEHAASIDKKMAVASSKRYTTVYYEDFVLFKLQLLSKLFTKDNSRQSLKTRNLALLPYVENVLSSANLKPEWRFYVFDLGSKRAFLLLMTGKSQEAHIAFKALYEQCRQLVRINDQDTPENIYKKLATQHSRLPWIYVSLTRGLGRSYFYLPKEQQNILFQKKCFDMCMNISEIISQQTNKKPFDYYLAYHSGLLPLKARSSQDKSNDLPKVIEGYEACLRNNSFYDDEGISYQPSRDFYNQVACCEELVKLNLELAQTVSVGKDVNEGRPHFKAALKFAETMLDLVKQAEVEEKPFERKAKYYNTLGRIWFDPLNLDRDLKKAQNYFKMSYSIEMAKNGNHDFPLADACYWMANIAYERARLHNEKDQWQEASYYIQQAVKIYQHIHNPFLTEAEKLHQSIIVDRQKIDAETMTDVIGFQYLVP